VQDWSVETVVVTAHVSGPAFWHIAKGNSEVWILGVVGPLPEDFKWDTGRLTEILKGANAMLLPPRGQIGLFEAAWFLIWHGDTLRLPPAQQLEMVLPGPLRSRFVAWRVAIHRDADRYAEYKPSVAGFRLLGDFLKANNFAQTEPVDTVSSLSRRADVPTSYMASYPALDVIKEVPTLSDAGNRLCLQDALDDIDVMSVHARPGADAWARGDLEGIKAHYSDPKSLDCLDQSATFNKLWARSVGDTAHAIEHALEKPGKTVAAVSIGELLRKKGVLEQLKADGLTVEGPGD
jgi:hypothetical protein